MTQSHLSLIDFKQYLRSLPMFEEVSDQVLAILSQSSRLQSLQPGEILFGQTDPAEAVYIVRSGCISIFLATPDGHELIINEMYEGDCFGELSLITDQTRSTGAMARKSSEVIVIPHDRFLEGLRLDQGLLRRVLETTARRLRVSSERESALAFLDSSARLSRILLQLDKQVEENDYIRVTQEELAQYVGSTRQTIAKTLGRWRTAGWVHTGRGKIKLLNRTALYRIAESLE